MVLYSVYLFKSCADLLLSKLMILEEKYFKINSTRRFFASQERWISIKNINN